MALFNKLEEPVFLRESSDAEEQLKQLKLLENRLTDEGKKILHKDIKFLEAGIAGEKNIAFELKNSHMPMYILHDVFLEQDDLTAQIDYMVFTRKECFVIECKNLYGNIEINNSGEFIRTMEYNGKKHKEGLYSPITQNTRHLELIRKLKKDLLKNALLRFILDRYFETSYKSLVVLANPKTILNDRYAKKEIKNQVIRADKLVSYIKESYSKSKESPLSDERLLAWAESFMSLHQDKQTNYTMKYNQYMIGQDDCKIDTMKSKYDMKHHDDKNNEKKQYKRKRKADNVNTSKLYKALKEYRLKRSRDENIKAYYIYNNKQMEDLIEKLPITIEELCKVDGFGEVKANKYGTDIFNIIKSHL